MGRPRIAVVAGVGALALVLCAGLSGCSRQPSDQAHKNVQQPQAQQQQAEQSKGATQPPQTQQQAEQPKGATQPPQVQQQQAEQPKSATQPPQAQQQQAEQPKGATQPPQAQQQAEQPQGADQEQQSQSAQPQQQVQQPQNQDKNRQNASKPQNETAAVNLNRDQIEQVQRALDQKGFNPGRADGKVGPKTQSALRSFQQQQKLEANGAMDQETLAALGLNDLTQSTTGQGRGQQQPASGRQGANQ